LNTYGEFKKFINGYYWYAGLRKAFVVLLPSIVLYHFGRLDSWIMMPLGASMVGLSDVVGAMQRRVTSMLLIIAYAFVAALLAGYTRDFFWLSLLVLIVLSFVGSLIGVYGKRITNMGSTGLTIGIFFMDIHFVPSNILWNATTMTFGGLFYLLVFFVSYKLRPYRLIEQLLGENLIEVAKLLRIKSGFYKKNFDNKTLLNRMMQEQVTLRSQQENIREVILKTRMIIDQTSKRGRALYLIFLDIFDLFEQIVNSQQDYTKLHKAFDDTHILTYLGKYMQGLANELQQLGLDVEAGGKATSTEDLSVAMLKCKDVFYSLRDSRMNAENMEDYIMLRQVIYVVQSMTERVRRLRLAASFDKETLEDVQSPTEGLLSFLPKQQYDIRLFFSNLSLKSDMFRHALRVTIALLAGFFVEYFFKLGHSYWIMMTTVIVLKPSFSFARERNIQRILGTIAGGAISFVIVYFVKSPTVLFVLLCLATLMCYSFSDINYMVFVIGLTMLVVMSYSFIAPHVFDMVLLERIMNSLIGAAIGFLASLFIFPSWESRVIQQYITDMINASNAYFTVMSKCFTGEPSSDMELKLKRKDFTIALANLSDNFQRMLTEPKKQRLHLQATYRFVAISHTLFSYSVSLASFALDRKHAYDPGDFKSRIDRIEYNFSVTKKLLTGNAQVDELHKLLPPNMKLVNMLEEQRKRFQKTTDENERDTSIAKYVTEYKTIQGLLELINSVVCDAGKTVATFAK
jgi:uncharacterized membrane protein YccC